MAHPGDERCLGSGQWLDGQNLDGHIIMMAQLRGLIASPRVCWAVAGGKASSPGGGWHARNPWKARWGSDDVPHGSVGGDNDGYESDRTVTRCPPEIT